MKEYITIGVIGVGLLATAGIVGLNNADTVRSAKAEAGDATGACPSSRAHLEASLNTVESDGMYYRLTRKSVHTPIRNVLVRMRGKARARETALSTRTFAEERLAQGVTGAEKRYYQDSILRADALLAILDCRSRQSAL